MELLLVLMTVAMIALLGAGAESIGVDSRVLTHSGETNEWI